jgi:hypothetical protein|tara:strand:- start:454 stop:918 length:465 start_codon:yes stop_codon:yes gene_type:complete
MIKSLFSLILITVLSFPSFAQYEEEAIKEVILEAYVNGVYNEGVLRNIKLGFSEKFQAFEIDKDGNMSVQNLEQWKAEVEKRIKDGKYPVSATEKVSLRYHNVDIFRNMAHVKITFLIGNQTYAREVLTLYKSPKGWLILTKTFQKQTSSKSKD